MGFSNESVKSTFSIYKGYTPAQLAEDEYFQQWVNLARPEEELFWNTFLELYPEQQETVLMARVLVLESDKDEEVEPLTPEEKSNLKKQILDQIRPNTTSNSLVRSGTMAIFKIAAVVAGLVLLTATLFKATPEKVYAIVEKSGPGESKRVFLADSSVVILNANSTLTYASNMAEAPSREIQLEGNAFFSIKKKADHKSFRVHANSLTIAVLGTEFNVNARSRETEVVLARGKVKVSSDNNNLEPVFMDPGEKVQFDPVKKSFVKSSTDAGLYEAWSDGKWHFSSTSMEEISDLIYSYYGIETIFTEPKVKSLTINGIIPVTDLASFTNIIAKTLDLDIVQKNKQLIIQH